MKEYVVLLGLCLLVCAYGEYDVVVMRVNHLIPIINKHWGESDFDYNYNPAYAPIMENGKNVGDMLFVRCQNASDPPPYGVGPSVIGFGKPTGGGFFDNLNEMKLDKLTYKDVIFESEGKLESYGVEDPRVVYREEDGTYYMMYSAVEQKDKNFTSRLALATNKTPWDIHS